MAHALEVIGDHWTLLILREAFYGVTRFEDMQSHLGLARNVLTGRLSHLVEQGLLERTPYKPQGQRTRHEYTLTTKGRDVFPVLMALMAWGDRYMPGSGGRPLKLVRRDGGQEVRVALVDERGQIVDDLRQLRAVVWPDRNESTVTASPES